MEFLSTALILVGGVVAFAGGIWLLVAAFRESFLWGLAYLCCNPIGPLVFVIKHWRGAARPFFLHLLGTLVLFGGVALLPEGLRPDSPEEIRSLLASGGVEKLRSLAERSVPDTGLLPELGDGNDTPEQARRTAPGETIYRWTDARGEVSYTNDFFSIPERYRAQAQTTLGGDVTFAGGEDPTPAPSRQDTRKARRDESSVRLLLFTAGWCPACRQLERSGVIEKFSAAHPQVSIERVDIDKEGARASQYGIRAIPTVVMTDPDGLELARPRTAGSLTELKRALSLARQR